MIFCYTPRTVFSPTHHQNNFLYQLKGAETHSETLGGTQGTTQNRKMNDCKNQKGQEHISIAYIINLAVFRQKLTEKKQKDFLDLNK